ncbi:Uncharacterised protein [Klebsiella pneumoniae]|nr:Uncharacterised protein [Klebsiella pneumoniae]
MQLKRKTRYHAKIGTRAAQTPEQFSIVLWVHFQHVTGQRNQLAAHQVIAGQAKLARQVTNAAAQGVPGDTDRGITRAGYRQTVRLRCRIQFAPGGSRGDVRQAFIRVNSDLLHAGQIKHQPILAGAVTGHVGATTSQRNRQLLNLRQLK